jgi:hypothetical protein
MPAINGGVVSAVTVTAVFVAEETCRRSLLSTASARNVTTPPDAAVIGMATEKSREPDCWPATSVHWKYALNGPETYKRTNVKPRSSEAVIRPESVAPTASVVGEVNWIETAGLASTVTGTFKRAVGPVFPEKSVGTAA